MIKKKCIRINSYPNEKAFLQVVTIAEQIFKKRSAEELEKILRKTPVKLTVPESVFNKLYEVFIKLGCNVEDCTVYEETDENTEQNNVRENVNNDSAFKSKNSESGFVEESGDSYENKNDESIFSNNVEDSGNEGEYKEVDTKNIDEKSNGNMEMTTDSERDLPDKKSVERSNFLYFDNWNEHGFFQSLWGSFTGIFSDPDGFFESLPEPKWINSLIFYLIFSIAPLGSSLVMAKKMLSSFLPSFAVINLSFILFSSLLLIFMFFFEVVNIHFSIIVFGKGRGIGKTMQIVSYLSVVKIFNIIPFFGNIITFYLYIVFLTSGLVKAHKFSVAKGVAASLFPIFIMVMFVIFVFFITIFFLGGLNAEHFMGIVNRFGI